MDIKKELEKIGITEKSVDSKTFERLSKIGSKNDFISAVNSDYKLQKFFGGKLYKDDFMAKHKNLYYGLK